MKIRVIVIALLMILALTGWFAFREYSTARRIRDYNHCVSNLCFIRAGKDYYQHVACTNLLTNGTVVTPAQIMPYIKGSWDFVCTTAGKDTYTIGRIGEEPACSVHGSLGNMHYPDGTRRNFK
jgi:hypothetical protein